MFANLILNALLPGRCPLCATKTLSSARAGFCAECCELLPWILIGCKICGAELHTPGVCGKCQTNRPQYDRAIIPFAYRPPVAAQIKSLKYRDQLNYAAALGAMICRRARARPDALPDILTPIPLHRKRLRRRGCNQAFEIARVIGRELGVAVDHRPLARIKNTAPQAGLGHAARRSNVRGAFRATRPARHPHIALVDDVVTSGSTVNAAARELKRAGVQTVSVWAAAKT